MKQSEVNSNAGLIVDEHEHSLTNGRVNYQKGTSR